MTPNVIGEKILKLHTPFKDAIKPVQHISTVTVTLLSTSFKSALFDLLAYEIR